MDDIEIENKSSNYAVSHSDVSLSELDMMRNDMEQNQDDVIYREENLDNSLIPTKRGREEDELEWTEVKTKEKKPKRDKIELYISSNEKLPKIFALAKIFKNLGLVDIERVKFLSPFKVRVDFNNDNSACKLETNQELINKGWRIHRAMETTMSFGVIKNVDINMEEDEILKSISCPDTIELLSAHRLKRRNKEEEGWITSESVRLGFKGSALPAYVSVDGLLIKVEPYVFPVSQCVKCWKFGHVMKRCPKNKMTCPKCGKDHANCETKNFQCVNCGGSHMSLAKSCPAFIKEKKLRDIMAEFNCTYRRAITMYVSPDSENLEKNNLNMDNTKERFAECITQPHFQTPSKGPTNEKVLIRNTDSPTFAEVVKTKAVVHENNKNTSRHLWRKSQQRPNSPFVWSEEFELDHDPVQNPKNRDAKDAKEETVHFRELLNKLKEVLFIKGETIQSKLKTFVKYCVEWLVLLVADYIPDWPILQIIFDYIIYSYG